MHRLQWLSLLFKVQLRLADFKFEQAQTLEEIQTLHAAFVETFNTTHHGAHLERDNGRRTPVEVLEWVRGRPVERATLRRLFGEVQFLRMVNRYGFVSVQRFYIYAEPGLSRQRVSIWVYEGELRIEYQQTLLARYRCTYNQRQQRLQDVSHPVVYQTPFASPQLELRELDAAQWIKVHQRAWYRRHVSRSTVPRTTLQAWRAWQERLDVCPQVGTFFASGPGLAYLHRLVMT